MANEMRSERPVVLIGAGGTGKQTLLLLRRMLFERYRVKTLPHIAQVVIDTDPAEKHLDDKEYDEFDREIRFERNELVYTPLGDALQKVWDNLPQTPHIAAWLDPSLKNHGDIRNGAGQIRSFGRLAFFQHFGAISAQLEQAYRKVTDQQAVDAAREHGIVLDTENGVDTWLVFSVAGGTGSGMFLDLAFLARQIGANYGGNGPPSAVILLPTAFVKELPGTSSNDPRHRPFANAYAAFMELETYNYSRSEESGRFALQWTPDLYASRQTVAGPVFENSWLIDNESVGGGGQVNGGRMALCHMMAEWFFFQYGGAAPGLATAVRSNRSNHTKVLQPLASVAMTHQDLSSSPQSKDEEGQTTVDEANLSFSRRYSSFGLSKIFVPTANLAEQAYSRLARDIAGLWLEPSGGGDPRRSVARYSEQLRIPADSQVSGYTSVLARALSRERDREPLSRRFEPLIDDKLQTLKGAGFPSGAGREARDWFSSEVMGKLLENGGAASRRGEISQAIDPTNTRAVSAQIKATLDQFVTETLKTPGERIDHADKALRLLVGEYEQLATEARAKATQLEHNGNGLQNEADQLLLWAEDHKGFDRATLFEGAFSKMRDRASYEFRRQALLAAAKVADEIADHIGVGRTMRDPDGKERLVDTGMLQTLAQLKETVHAIRHRAAERIEALRRRPSSSLNCRAPATDEEEAVGSEAELNKIYVDAEGQAIGHEALERYEQQLYEDRSHVGFTSPWFWRGVMDATRVEDAFDQMRTFGGRELRHLTQRMEDALFQLRQKCSRGGVEGAFKAEVERVAARGTPWLPPYNHYIPTDAYKNLPTETYLACSDRADSAARAALTTYAPGRQPTTAPLDTVYFAAEVAGVPLFAVRHMNLYRKAYFGYLRDPDAATRVVHNERDVEKFVGLLPYTSDEMFQRNQAVRGFIRGLVAGVVVPVPATPPKAREWQFAERQRFSTEPVYRWLGRYPTAIQYLSESGSTYWSALLGELNARYEQHVQHEDLARIYLCVDQMIHRPPVPGSEWTSAARRVLEELRNQHGQQLVEEATAARDSFAAWGEELPSAGANPFRRIKALVPPTQG